MFLKCFKAPAGRHKISWIDLLCRPSGALDYIVDRIPTAFAVGYYYAARFAGLTVQVRLPFSFGAFIASVDFLAIWTRNSKEQANSRFLLAPQPGSPRGWRFVVGRRISSRLKPNELLVSV